MYRNERMPRLTYSEIYNFLKYNGFEETLKLYDFKLLGSDTNNIYREIVYKFESISDDCICMLSLIGNYENVLDCMDEDFISRLAGYSDEKQFVPKYFSFSIKSYITEKTVKDHNDGNFVRYNHPKDYVVCINLDVDEIIYKANDSYETFIRLLKDYVIKLKEELDARFPKSEYHHRNNNKIVVEFPRNFGAYE